MNCYYCGPNNSTKHGSLNDGGTVICGNCGGLYHPKILFKSKNVKNNEEMEDIVFMESHPHAEKGPMSCDHCKKGKALMKSYITKNIVGYSCVNCKNIIYDNDDCFCEMIKKVKSI